MASTPIIEKGLEGFVSLNSMIDTQKLSCLNESSNHTGRDLLKEGGDKWLESDSDEELLLHLALNSSCRIRAIRLTTLPSAISQAPKTLKIYCNQPSLGFDDIMLEADNEFELTEEQALGKSAIQLRYVKFQNTTTISIFVKDNQGGEDTTRIDKIELIGVSQNHTDVSKLDRSGHDHE